MLGSFRTSIIVGMHVCQVNFLVVSDDTLSKEVHVLLGRDFTNGNRIAGIVFNRETTDSAYDPQLMNRAFGDDRLCMQVDGMKDLELDIGDTEETKNFGQTIENFFRECYVDRPKPKEPLVKM